MGNSDSKLHFRKAVIQLTTKTQPVEASEDVFWDQFWTDINLTAQDIFALVPAAEIRAVREESPSNLATLCYKAVERLVLNADSGCVCERDRQAVLSCIRLLTRILPYIFEDPDWRGFFWSTVPKVGKSLDEGDDESTRPLAESLLTAISDLLFCPDFTVESHSRTSADGPSDIQSMDSCEFIWEAGVGFAQTPPLSHTHDSNRTELLKLLLTCFSEEMYQSPSDMHTLNPWVSFFCSRENRHALPLFTSLLNVVCAYDPVGYGIPYNHLMFSDQRGVLAELALQTLIVSLEQELVDNSNTSTNLSTNTDTCSADYKKNTTAEGCQATRGENLFVNYLSRIHREEDFHFILRGIGRLLNNPLLQTYLPHSCKKIQFHQELLVLFWKLCDLNKKFLFYVLKSSDVLDILVPILFYLTDARANQSRVGLVHIGMFILLLLSGERNFGVRLNKPYCVRVPMDISVFAGTHADLLIVVFHKIITSGHQRLQPLYDCLLTIIVNVSPYLKSLSMVAANKLLHLLEVFSSPWFLFCSPVNHHLVFFLLEVFNNIIQYQFDGNFNLVYGIIRKRNLFHQLANLPTDVISIQKALQKKSRSNSTHNAVFMETSNPYNTACSEGPYKTTPVQTGTLNASLKAMPRIDKLTETSQVSEDGATLLLQQRDSTHSQSDHSSETQVRDTEPTSGEDDKKSEKEDCDGSPKHVSSSSDWAPTPDWVLSWKSKLPLQTIMRLLQVLVPQVEKICIDKGLTDESEILKFLQHGTLVGLLPVPHPILIRKYQANEGTALWFRTYMWGIIYLRNVDPPVWYDTDVKLFEIQRI
ncbi:protein HID1b isoform X1 [Sinocyclocheilus rhinocerous]|uniref:Protein HID1-like n=1 Tax=Sinocyclocheilus rhinocerous TaxID=307959 RepID=A0A673NIS5_9TELE|nr:PREDICTED: protein HID1-like isoform X1 [Sinocyclocheilus rhinocerous]